MKNDSISIAKGIGIMLMVIGHSYCPKYLTQFIYMFHMPLFFFFSGYCLQDKNFFAPPIYFVNKKLKGLYKPFVKWSLIFLILHNVFYYINIYNNTFGYNNEVSMLYTIKDFAINTIKILLMVETEQLLGGYWFLKSLLLASIFGYYIIKLQKNTILLMCILIATSIFLSFYQIESKGLQLGVKDSLAIIFYVMGYYFHKLKVTLNIKLGLFSFSIVAIGVLFWPSTMSSIKYWAIIPYITSAICGTLGVFYVSNQITLHTQTLRRILVYIGNNSLVILTWHFLCFKLVSLIIISVYGLQIDRLAEFPVIKGFPEWFLIYAIAGIFIPILLSLLKSNLSIK